MVESVVDLTPPVCQHIDRKTLEFLMWVSAPHSTQSRKVEFAAQEKLVLYNIRVYVLVYALCFDISSRRPLVRHIRNSVRALFPGFACIFCELVSRIFSERTLIDPFFVPSEM